MNAVDALAALIIETRAAPAKPRHRSRGESGADGYTICSRCRRTRQSDSMESCVRAKGFRGWSLAASSRRSDRASELAGHNVQELIAYAKARPGKLNYASVGVGSPAPCGRALQLKPVSTSSTCRTGRRSAVSDTIGGQVHWRSLSMPAALQHVNTGVTAIDACRNCRGQAQHCCAWSDVAIAGVVRGDSYMACCTPPARHDAN